MNAYEAYLKGRHDAVTEYETTGDCPDYYPYSEPEIADMWLEGFEDKTYELFNETE